MQIATTALLSEGYSWMDVVVTQKRQYIYIKTVNKPYCLNIQ